MPDRLSKRIVARMKKKDGGLKRSNRTIFLALKDEIEEALNDGWAVKVVWETLHEEGKVAFSYQAFNGYVNRLIKKAPEKSGAQPEETGQGATLASKANDPDKDGNRTGPKMPDVKQPKFDWANRKTTDEELIG